MDNMYSQPGQSTRCSRFIKQPAEDRHLGGLARRFAVLGLLNDRHMLREDAEGADHVRCRRLIAERPVDLQ